MSFDVVDKQSHVGPFNIIQHNSVPNDSIVKLRSAEHVYDKSENIFDKYTDPHSKIMS